MEARDSFCFPKNTKNPNPSPIEKRFGFSISVAVLLVDIPTRCPACGVAVLFKSCYPPLQPKGNSHVKQKRQLLIAVFFVLHGSFPLAVTADKRT